MYIRYVKYINKYNKSYDEERKKEIFYTFKLMARGWYSSCLIRFVLFFSLICFTSRHLVCLIANLF